jgi:hypothetical protein
VMCIQHTRFAGLTFIVLRPRLCHPTTKDAMCNDGARGGEMTRLNHARRDWLRFSPSPVVQEPGGVWCVSWPPVPVVAVLR